MNFKEHFILGLSKVLDVIFYIVIPVIFVGVQKWIIGFLCMHITLGLSLAVVFKGHCNQHPPPIILKYKPTAIGKSFIRKKFGQL